MRKSMLLVATAALLISAASTGAAKTGTLRTGGPPNLQVGPSCEAAGKGAVMLGRNKEACLADETTAHDTLKQNWSTYSSADKSQCIGMQNAGGSASYVELVSCVEIMRDARNIRNGDALESDNAKVSAPPRKRR